MGFEIIKAEDRLTNILIWFAGLQAKITDFVVGGKTRTKLEAICVEMERQDFATEQLIRKAIPTSTYNTFNFPLNPALRSYGQVTFTASPAPAQAFVIKAGSRVATSSSTEITYETVADVTVQIGQTSITTDVICTTAGTNGNTGTSTVTEIKSSLPGITAVTNVAAIGGGSEVETESDRRARFNIYVGTLSRGTSSALTYGAMTAHLSDALGNPTESVISAKVTEPPLTGAAGTSSIYIYNGSTGATGALVTQCQKVIDGYYDANNEPIPGYKAAGVVVTVAAATTVPTICSMSISVMAGFSLSIVTAAAISAIETYFLGLGVGEQFVRHEIIQRVMSINGVYNLTMPFPDLDVTPLFNQVVTLETTIPLTSRVTSSTWAG